MRKGGKRSVSDGSGRSAPRLSYDEGVYFFVFSTRVVLQTLNPRAPPPREGVGYVRPRDRSGRVVVGGALVRTHSRSDQPSPPVSLERTYHSRDALKSRTNALESMDAPPSSPNTPARPAPPRPAPRAPLPNRPALDLARPPPAASRRAAAPAFERPPPRAASRRSPLPPRVVRVPPIPHPASAPVVAAVEVPRAPGGSGRVAASSVRDPASANRSPMVTVRVRVRVRRPVGALASVPPAAASVDSPPRRLRGFEPRRHVRPSEERSAVALLVVARVEGFAALDVEAEEIAGGDDAAVALGASGLVHEVRDRVRLLRRRRAEVVGRARGAPCPSPRPRRPPRDRPEKTFAIRRIRRSPTRP